MEERDLAGDGFKAQGIWSLIVVMEGRGMGSWSIRGGGEGSCTEVMGRLLWHAQVGPLDSAAYGPLLLDVSDTRAARTVSVSFTTSPCLHVQERVSLTVAPFWGILLGDSVTDSAILSSSWDKSKRTHADVSAERCGLTEYRLSL